MKKVIISFIIIVAVIAGYFLFKNSEQNKGSDNIYKNDLYDFSLKLSGGMQASSFQEGEGDTIIISDPSTGFQTQIYVSPFDEDIVLNEERIKQDLPDMIMENVGEMKVGGVTAVSFTSTNDQSQKTKEIWFVKDFNLYQINSDSKYEESLKKLVETWVF